MAKWFTAEDKRLRFLATCLYDALEDENIPTVHTLLDKHLANPYIIVKSPGITPLHYACGMDNIQVSEEITEKFLSCCKGDPNVATEDGVTPLHVAAMNGRTKIAKMLLDAGARCDAQDNDLKTPIQYAIEEKHFDVIDVIKTHVSEKKVKAKASKPFEKRNISATSTPNRTESNSKSGTDFANNLLTVKSLEIKNYTPNKINYNYDVTSPYYINITHRRKQKFPDTISTEQLLPSQPSKEGESPADTASYDLFSLRKEQIEIIAKEHELDNTQNARSEVWRNNVKRPSNRQSLLKICDDLETLIETVNKDDFESLDGYITPANNSPPLLAKNRSKTSHVSSISTESEKPSNSKHENLMIPTIQILEATAVESEKPSTSKHQNLMIPTIQILEATAVDHESSFQTASDFSDENFIRSPSRQQEDCIVHMTEKYVHSDNEYDLEFYEMKLLNTQLPSPNSSRGSEEDKENKGDSNSLEKQTGNNVSLPLSDYDTDLLREELTAFGEPPGPITKTTKKLYARRLAKYKHNASEILAERETNKILELDFSVELNKTIRDIKFFQQIPEYLGLVTESSTYFANSKKKMREGTLKQSFIYLLLDPNISQNLPVESKFMTKFDVWKRFLQSIFYVGKGKLTRPYSHLYDAIKLYSKAREFGSQIEDVNVLKFLPYSPKVQQDEENKKLKRIIRIWNGGKGVVCLHVFHSILPAEAYTREAAMIEALGLNHLTNMKKGDYYGVAQTWSMRTKRHMGIALLFQAMKMFVIEGESQISPRDLK